MKGLISLFTSGKIFSPQVLFAVILGFILGTKLKIEQIMQIYASFEYYVMVFCTVGIYVFIFKQVHKNAEGDIDWGETVLRWIGYSLVFLLANMLTVSFVFSMLM